ncbi:MAG: hypothetical protein KJ675_07205 [Gammaproteobacteria bacterium]|nr:hypothetical protein [Gammaproteobacteria bacterium]MBU1960995.1 hypothetical protein [Gammaproteobacteria bacterium]
MSIWDDDPKNIIGGWEYLYEHEGLWARIRGRGPYSLRSKWKEIRVRLDELCQTMPKLKQAKAQWSVREADLCGYRPYEPVMDIDLRLASPEVIGAELQRRIDQQGSRIEELCNLVAPWGIDLDGGIASLDALNLWFSAYLRLFTKKEFLAHVRENKAPHCNPYNHRAPVVWYSISMDISLYMMSMLQRACPCAHWGISKTKQEHVLFYDRLVQPLYNRPVLILTSSNDAYADFEQDLWFVMRLLNGNNVTRSYLFWLSREYKKKVTACQRLAKKKSKKTKANASNVA